MKKPPPVEVLAGRVVVVARAAARRAIIVAAGASVSTVLALALATLLEERAFFLGLLVALVITAIWKRARRVVRSAHALGLLASGNSGYRFELWEPHIVVIDPGGTYLDEPRLRVSSRQARELLEPPRATVVM